MAVPWPDALIDKTEEKGSDVNLASHLLLDAFRGDFDVAAILSNDSDWSHPSASLRKNLAAWLACSRR